MVMLVRWRDTAIIIQDGRKGHFSEGWCGVIGFVTVMLVRWRGEGEGEAGMAPNQLSPSGGLTPTTTPAYYFGGVWL